MNDSEERNAKSWLMLLCCCWEWVLAGEFSEERHEWRAKRNRDRICSGSGELGSEDLTGPYELVKNWPQDVSTLPGNEKWTYGAGESVFAESPNRIYMLFRGELPKMAPPKAVLLPQLGPSITFPVAGFWRDATVASLPGTGGTDNDMQRMADLVGREGAGPRESRGRPIASWAWTRNGRTAWWWWMATARSSRPGSSGTSCSGVRTPSTSARTIRKRTSGSLTTICR